MPSLAVKYRPDKWEDVSEQSVIVDMLKGLCEKDTLDCRNFLLIGPAGCGKAQPLYSQVLTTSGYVAMQDIRVGDEVFTSKGNIGHVVEIFPQGKRDIYRINVSDGSHIDVADNHLNEVFTLDPNESGTTLEYVNDTLETTELIQRLDRYDFGIHSVKVPFAEANLPIAPYLVGMLIGLKFGDSKLMRIECVDESVISKLNSILRTYWNVELVRQFDNYWNFYSLKEHHLLTQANVNNPFIHAILDICDCNSSEFCGFYQLPSMYIYSSLDQRFDLLKGLADSGFIEKAEEYLHPDDEEFSEFFFSFEVREKKLSESLACLIRSIGMIDKVSIVPKQDVYHHEIFVEGTADLVENFPLNFDEWMTGSRFIESIDYIGPWECQCIMIDHDDHTYISDGMIPTHNTTSARIMASHLNEGLGEPIEIDCASHGSVEAVREIIQQARSYPIGSKYKIFIMDEAHAVTPAGWSAFLKALEEQLASSIMIFCTTNPEKIPDTIISRVQVFQLSKISLDGIQKRLKFVLDSEIAEGRDIQYTDDAVNFISRLAQGGMREGISLLERAIAYSNVLNADTISKALSLPAYDDFFALLGAINKKNNGAIVEIVDKVYNSGVNFVKWFQDFHSFVMNIVKYIYMKEINSTMIPSTYESKIAVYNQNHAIVCLKLANKLVKLNQDLRTTQYLQETALTYLCDAKR